METTNLSKIKREKMLETIKNIKKNITDETTLDNLSMIENEFKVWNENVDAAKKIAKENGAQFIEVNIKPFQESVKQLQEEVVNISDTTKNIFEEVRKLSN